MPPACGAVFAALQKTFAPSACIEIVASEVSGAEVSEKLQKTGALIVIDGRHSFREILNGFMNAERAAASSSLVLVSDVAHRDMEAGDGWRIIEFLRRNREDLQLFLTGKSLVIFNLDRENRRLWEHYNPLVAQMQRLQLVPDKVLGSVPSTDVDDPSWANFVAQVKEVRRPS